MWCFRFDLRKKLMPYVDGRLDSRTVQKIERHLLDCNACRLQVKTLQTGHRLMTGLPVLTPTRDPWEAIEAALVADSTKAEEVALAAGSRRWGVHAPGLALAGVLSLALAVTGIWLIRTDTAQKRESESFNQKEVLDLKRFQPVSVTNIKDQTEPHIVAEGVVTAMELEEKDGDFTFKLIEDASRPDLFIVCEIIEPIRLVPPKIGSRVKVYGVRRFDDKSNHQWFEVHPVLNIEQVKR